jgi:Alphavirus glycoprotein J
VTRGFKPFSALLLAALAACLLCALPGQASAAKPCWQNLLYDWADNGHIDKVYPIACYREALHHLPKDIQTYSDAQQAIQRALQQELTTKKPVNTKIPFTTTTTAVTTTPSGQTTTTKKVETIAAPTTTNSKKGFIGAINHINPSSPTAFPLPLLILGALAILLVLAGLGGMLYRRYWGGTAGGPGPGAPAGP